MKSTSVVNKLTKEQLGLVLNTNFSMVKKASKEPADRISYTAKAYKKEERSVSKKDLWDLVKDSMTALGDKFILATESTDVAVPILAENSVKPKLSSKSKTKEKVEEPEEETEETPKKTGKKSSKKESAVKIANPEEEKMPAILLADTFKEEIEVEGDKYQIAHDIKTMDDLIKSFDNEETVVFAMYWSKRHLKQFNYFNGDFKAPTEFPQDLDLASCIYVSDEGIVAYAVSMYTDSCYMFFPQNFEEVDGVRFAGGVEYQIYRLVE